MADEKSVVCDDRLRHIAFIMDGNGRWARKRLLPRESGHKAGAGIIKQIVRHCGDIGIKVVTLYAFSTENWKRSEREISALMSLLSSFIDEATESFEKEKVKVVFLGDLDRIPERIAKKARKLEELTSSYERRLNIALNYGGRAEIVNAVNKLLEDGKKNVSEDDISGMLYTAGCPDPDLIVRTAGEYRLSNFLMWQSAYSELYFTDTLWPDLTNEDVDKAVISFYSRKRNFGGIK